MYIDDLGLSIGSKLFEHYELLQPQIEQLYNIKQRYSEIFDTQGVWANMMENWSSVFGLSNLGMSENYSHLISEMRKITTPEVMGISSAINEFADLTASLRESISYSGLSRAVESFQSSITGNMDLETLENTVVGLSKIFDDDIRIKLEDSIHLFSSRSDENMDIMDDFLESIDEEEYEGFSLDEQGSLVCDGSIITIEEIRQIILDCLNNTIDWIKNSKIEFEMKHKIVCFVIRAYLEICVVLGMAPAQPVISIGEKAISMENSFDNKYFVSEEDVKVYSTPTSKSKVIYHVSYGKTVISESDINGWIKVSITAGDEVYHGWIAKCNLISYDKAKFHSDELEHEIE